jgi:ATP-dependent RNA helicase DDX19/DBP5
VLNVQYVRIFVLDEADHMVDKNTGANTLQIKKALNPAVQTLFFSATYTPDVIKMSQVIIFEIFLFVFYFCFIVHTVTMSGSVQQKIVPKAYLIRPQTQEELVLDVIFQVRMDVTRIRGGKLQALKDIYGFLAIQKSIIFVERKCDVDLIAALLYEAGLAVSPIHGGMTHEERDFIMDQFQKGLSKVLITTNVLARGFDDPEVAVVVNYDIPVQLVNGKRIGDEVVYLHRIGRCGRFGRKGTAITFVETPEEKFMLEQIEKFYSPHQRLTTDWDPMEIEELSAEIRNRPEGSGVSAEAGLTITLQG